MPPGNVIVYFYGSPCRVSTHHLMEDQKKVYAAMGAVEATVETAGYLAKEDPKREWPSKRREEYIRQLKALGLHVTIVDNRNLK